MSLAVRNEEAAEHAPLWFKQPQWGEFTYKDYLGWGDGIRVELIDGIPHMMAGASQWHQRMSRNLVVQLANFLHGKKCEVFYAPFDVRLFPQEDLSDRIVVQPDIFVVCDKSKLDGKACLGPPDFIIEILSAGSESIDLGAKFRLYEKAGVKEYWVVGQNFVNKYNFSQQPYSEKVITVGPACKIPVDSLEGCILEVQSQ